MMKIDSLRAALTAGNKDLRANPDKIATFIEGGTVVATQTSGLGFEYVYTAVLVLSDYAGPLDAIFLPLLGWIKINQVEILANRERAAEAIKFDAEILDGGAYDIEIKLPLTERAIPVKRLDGGFDITHADERAIGNALQGFFPGVDDVPAGTNLVEIYIDDELVAEVPEP